MPVPVHKTNTLADGASSTAAQALELPESCRVLAVSIEASAINTPPVWAVISIGDIDQFAMTLTRGWVRGPTAFQWTGGILWTGEYDVYPDKHELVYHHVRNNTGATISYDIEAAVVSLPQEVVGA